MDSVTTSGFAILGLHVGETEKKKKKKEKRTNLKDSLRGNTDSLLSSKPKWQQGSFLFHFYNS